MVILHPLQRSKNLFTLTEENIVTVQVEEKCVNSFCLPESLLEEEVRFSV